MYEEDVRVPLIVRGPSVPKGRRLDAMVINNDLAPTFAAMAGIEPPEFVDGRSFLPLFEDAGRPWRHRTLIRRRGLGSNGVMSVTSFIALRTATWTYVEYEGIERELYDLTQDPYQLDNRAKTADPAPLNELSNWVNALSSCAAAFCRELEDQPLS